MKRMLSVLFLLIGVVSGCGGSKTQQSAFCQSVDTVKSDVNTLKSNLKSNPSLDTLKTDLQQLQKNVNTAITETKNQAKPQVSALKTSLTQLKGTLQQVKNKQTTLRDALPTIKSQTQTVSQNWQSLKAAMKC